MIRGRSRLTVVIAAIVLMACMVAGSCLPASVAGVSAAAAATSKLSARQQAAFARAMGRYVRIEGSTTPAEVRAQMQSVEAGIDPCVPQLKQFYAHEGSLASGDPALPQLFDRILGWGAELRGERWNTDAVRPFVAPDFIDPLTRIDICAVIGSWSTKNYAASDQPKIAEHLVSPGLSPYVATGTKLPATFREWGFSKSAAQRLTAELSTGAARFNKLDKLAAAQFAGWLKQQGIYQLMQAGDQQAMAF